MIESILKELKKINFSSQMICVSRQCYDKIIKEAQELDFDYDSPLVDTLGQIMLVIDMDLEGENMFQLR